MNEWLPIVYVSDDYQKPECDSEIVSWVESKKKLSRRLAGGKYIDVGIIMFEFLRRIVCIDDSTYSFRRWWMEGRMKGRFDWAGACGGVVHPSFWRR